MPGEPEEAQVAALDRRGRGGGELLQPQRGGLPVVHRVVGVHRAAGQHVVVPRADQGVLEALLRLGVVRERHLVGLDLARLLAGVLQREQLDADDRALLGVPEHPGPAYVDDGEVAALAAEPAGGQQVVVQRADGVVVHVVPPSTGAADRLRGRQPEPVEAVGAERQQVGQLADLREADPAEQLDRGDALEAPQVELHRLREPGQVVDAEHGVGGAVLGDVLADVAEHARVGATEVAEVAEPEGGVLLAGVDHPAGPVQQRGGVLQLGLDVDALVAEDRVLDRRQVQPARGGVGEAGVAVRRPLHRGADPVAVAEPDVVAHPDLVAVVEHRRPGQREQQRGEQLHGVHVVVEQRRQPAADADVGLHAGVLGVLAPHVVAVLVGDHLEGQLVVVAQEDAPLAVVGDRRRLLEDLRDREARLAPHRHEDARHHREVEAHVALVAGRVVLAGLLVALAAEVVDDVGGPLVGLGEQHPAGVLVVDEAAHLAQELVGLRQVLAVGAGALVEVRAPRRAGSRRGPCRARSASPPASRRGPSGCRS